MRITRPVIALAITASFLATGVASAATKPKPKPVCNLVTDAAGDAQLGPAPSDSTVDIVGGDIASDAKNVTAVLRLKDLSASSTAVTGKNYYAQFTVASYPNPIYLSYETDPTGTSANWGELAPGTGGVGTYTSKGKATSTLDKVKNEIHLSVPVSDLAALASVKPGTKITSFHLNTTAAFVVLVSDVDSADASKVYIAGAKSCVTPGK